jgi:hypothetical protein
MSEYSNISKNGFNYLEYSNPKKITPPQQFVGVGKSCSGNVDCNFGLYCYPTNQTSNTKNGICSEWSPDNNSSLVNPVSYYNCLTDSDCQNKKCIDNFCQTTTAKESFDYITHNFDYNDYTTIQLTDPSQQKMKSSIPTKKMTYSSKYNTQIGSNYRTDLPIGI